MHYLTGILLLFVYNHVIMFVVKSEWFVGEVLLLAAFVTKNVWSLALQLLSCSVSEGLITFSQQLLWTLYHA